MLPTRLKCVQLLLTQVVFFATVELELDLDKGDVAMDLDKGDMENERSNDEELNETEEGETLEPRVGMEFESEEAARNFYVEYARGIGFSVRVMQRRRSGIDGRTLARRLGCNKQGFSPNPKGAVGSEKKQRLSAREGCNATILIKMDKSEKWVVTRFVKDHNHPLVIINNECNTMGDKDKKIEELTKELEHQEQLYAACREKLFTFIDSVEDITEELTSKIHVVVENVRRIESESQKPSDHR
ncbi:hypothetical protein ACFE04_029268 [Oxalis oulophora]